MDYSKYKELNITKENKILTISINRPNDMNAVNEQLHGEFSTIFIDAEYDDLPFSGIDHFGTEFFIF